MSDKVTLIIPCYFYDEDLIGMTEDCLESLDEMTPNLDVIIVDDGSPIPYRPEVCTKYIHLNENKGYAGAVNAGLIEAKGDVLVICNNDVEFIQEDWLNHLLKPLNEGYDISSIRTTDADGWNVEDYISEGDKFGSIWAMKREVYEVLGGLSEDYGKGYFEDLDYHRRAEHEGFKVGKNHAGLVLHKGKATFKIVDPEDTSFEESRDKFIQKHGKHKL